METVTDFIFLGSKITADGDSSHEIKTHLFLGRTSMINLVKVKSLSHVPTLCDPMDCSPLGSSVHALNSPLTAAALNCDPKMCSQVCWNRNRGGMQGDLGQDNRDVSRNRVHFLCSSEELGLLQKYQSGLPFPSPGDLPDPGVEPRSPALQADSVQSEPPGKP